MRNGDDRTALCRSLKGFDDAGLGIRIQVCGHLVKQQHLRVADDCTGDGEELELSLGEELLVHRRIQPVRDPVNDIGKTRDVQRLFDIRLRAAAVIQRDLIPYGAGDRDELLFDKSEQMALFLIRQKAGVLTLQGYDAFIRLVEAAEQGKDGGLSGTGPSGKGDIFSGFNGEGKILQHRTACLIGEGNI